jgi:hypothetical protein
MEPFDYEGIEEPDTSLDDEDVESLEDYNVFEECDSFDDFDYL